MVSGRRVIAVTALAAAGLVASVAACAGPTNGSAPVTTTPAGSQVPSTSAPAEPSPPATATAGTKPPAGHDSFVLTAGAVRQACGIALRVRFIPPSGSDNHADQAFLVGTGPGQPDPDQPAPGAVTPARAGVVAVVLGQRFMVVAIDLTNDRVTLDALC